MSDWSIAVVLMYSPDTWTRHRKPMPFINMFRGDDGHSVYLKLGRFLLSVHVAPRCLTDEEVCDE